MEHYVHFIGEWGGLGFAVPFMFAFALFGPFALLFLNAESKAGVLRNLAIFMAACAMISFMFLCIGSGVYLGKFHGLGGWGIPLGFLFFIGTGFGLAIMERAISQKKLRRRSSGEGKNP